MVIELIAMLDKVTAINEYINFFMGFYQLGIKSLKYFTFLLSPPPLVYQ